MIRFQAGDRSAFDEIDKRYRGRLIRFIRRRSNSQELAEEIVQDALTRALCTLPRLKNGRLLSQWLYRIVYNDWIDYMRKNSSNVACAISYDNYSEGRINESRQGSQVAVFSEKALRPTGGTFDFRSPEQRMEQLERRDNIWRIAKETLSGVEFQVLWAKYVDEASDEEIGQIVGKKVGAVRVALSRIRKKLASRVQLE